MDCVVPNCVKVCGEPGCFPDVNLMCCVVQKQDLSKTVRELISRPHNSLGLLEKERRDAYIGI